MIDIITIASIFNLKNNSKTITSQLQFYDFLPNLDIFGVFTTIIRSQTLNQWPEDIHGCLGYWTNDYSKMDKKTILEKIIDLSYDTNHKDSRKNYFKRPLSEDSSAYVEISYMLLPIIEVKNGKINNKNFNNDEYGLIVDSGGKRATYLPKVFGNIKWEELKKSIKMKASISSEKNKFYAYKTKIVKVPIYKTLFSSKFINIMENPVKQFYLNISNILPYAVINGKIKEDLNESVRNLGTLGDMIKICNSPCNGILEYLDYYYQLYKENPIKYRQSAAFLLEDYFLLNIHNDRQKEIINYLYSTVDDMEPRFELGEVLKILSVVEPRENILEKQANKMYERLDKMDKLDDVFELNWQSQFMEKTRIPSRKRNARKITEILLRILDKKYVELETNYLAVIYECLSNLVKIVKNKELKNRRMEYFVKLNKRIGKYGLYYFRGMREARLDITSHVIFQP